MTIEDLPNFPTTRFSAFHGLKDNDPNLRRGSWELLISVYWRPAYAHLRLKWKIDRDTAADLIQSFFMTAFEKQYLVDFDPGVARFRTYLRTCLDRFAMKEHVASHRLKRGGAAEHQHLDFDAAEREVQSVVEGRRLNADFLFDQEWVKSIFTHSIEKFQQSCAADDHAVHLALFEAYDLEEDDSVTYQSLAAKYSLSEETVTNYLAWARRHFRLTVLKTIAELTANEEEYREEVKAVLGIKLG